MALLTIPMCELKEIQMIALLNSQSCFRSKACRSVCREVITTGSGCFDDWQGKLAAWTESCSEEFAKAEKGWAVKVSKYLFISAQYVQC